MARHYRVRISSGSTPDNPKLGYGDWCTVFPGIAAVRAISSGPVRVPPNPWRPSDSAPWFEVYGWLAPGMYRFECVNHSRFGTSLLLEEGGPVKSRTPNPNHEGRTVLTEVFVHRGGTGTNPQWPGSAGCITTSPEYSDEFFGLFQPGDVGIVEIIQERKAPVKKGKSILTSKTFWTNLVALVAMGIQAVTNTEVVPAETQAALLGVVNVVLRIVTRKPIEW